MTKNKSVIIFSIDKCHEVHTLAKFLSFCDKQKAMGNMTGVVKINVGKYEGKLEISFTCSYLDWNMYIKDSGYVDNQMTYLEVTEDNRVYKNLLHGGGILLGKMSDGSITSEDFTYDIKRDKYYTVV